MPKGVYPRPPAKPFNPTKVVVECKDCGVKYLKVPSAVAKWSGFCKNCIGKQRIGKPLPSWWIERSKKNRTAPSGENHHNWKGGISDPNDAERIKFRKRIQKPVFERDDYTCQICQQRGNHLQVDHIKSWAEHPELRFDMANCRTLCMACHYYVTFKRKMPKGIVWGHNFGRRVTS